MRPDHRFLLTCSAITCAAVIAAVVPVPAILRTLIAIPLVFVLPGAALLRALDLQFSPCSRVPIVVGLSMAITVLSGLALDWLGGLTPLGWAAWLGGVSILAAAVAAQGNAAGIRALPPTVRVRHGVMLAATVAVVVLTFLGTLRGTATYHPFPHTSFWMLPEEAASNVYLIGIKNNEGRTESYAVQLMVDQRITGEWQDLELASGQSVTYPVMVPQGAPAQAWLYRAEQPNAIYRKVSVAGNEVMESETDSAGDPQ